MIIIPVSLGEALQVEPSLKSNQSPDAPELDEGCEGRFILHKHHHRDTQNMENLFVHTKKNFVRFVALW